jgi:serine/threonine-protein kinase
MLRERLENLESIVCSVDTELNMRLSRLLAHSQQTALLAAHASSGAQPSAFPTGALTRPLVAGHRLGDRYEIRGEIGRGGMGTVYEAFDLELGERVAIKFLSPMVAGDPEAAERFRREVSTARRITHPNVIRIHDLGEHQGIPFISMEFFGGTTVKQIVRAEGALPTARLRPIICQVCDGLGAAHGEGVIHRDLKPQNMLVGSDGRVKVIDFGLAKSHLAAGLSATGVIMGTPEYMSPEQIRGQPVDHRTDIYALGASMYEMATGRVPFGGDTPIAISFAQVREHPLAPEQVNPKLPPAWSHLILACMSKEPGRRPASAEAIRAEIDRLPA